MMGWYGLDWIDLAEDRDQWRAPKTGDDQIWSRYRRKTQVLTLNLVECECSLQCRRVAEHRKNIWKGSDILVLSFSLA
jgi:hypothetical protein